MTLLRRLSDLFSRKPVEQAVVEVEKLELDAEERPTLLVDNGCDECRCAGRGKCG